MDRLPDISDPREIKEPMINCYEVAFRFVVSNPGWSLTHGTIEIGAPRWMLAHAWVVNDTTGEVRDIKDEMRPKALRWTEREMNPIYTEARYTFFEAKRLRQHAANRLPEFGPWHSFNGIIRKAA